MAKKMRNEKNGAKVKLGGKEYITPKLEHWLLLPEDQFHEITQDVCDFRAYLTQDGSISKKEAVSIHKQQIEAMQKIAEDKSKKLGEIEKLISLKNAEVKDAEEAVRKASEVLYEKRKQREKLIRQNEYIDSQLQQSNKALTTLKEALAEMNDVVLLHPSATCNQLKKYQCEDIIVSKTDVAFFFELERKTQGILSVDGVFDSDDSFVSEFPSDFFFKNSPGKAKSIKDYCEMVIHAMLEDDGTRKIIPVFDNSDIEEILKLNGMEI